MKADLCTTLKRLENIRQVLKENRYLNIKSLSDKTKIPPTTISFYILKYFKGKIQITKIGKEKLVSLVDSSKTDEETKLGNRENKFNLAEDLRKRGLTYSEIKASLKSQGHYMADGQISEKVRDIKIEQRFMRRYRDKIINDKARAGKVGGKTRVSMSDFKDFQISGTESIKKRALERIPASAKRITKNKIWIIGHCIFDGSVIDTKGYSAISYTNKSRYLINQFKKNMLQVYSLNPTDLRKREGDIYVIRYCSTAAVRDLGLVIKREIPEFIMNSPKDRKALFLKTFWDDEGAVHFGTYRDKRSYIHINRHVEAFCENDLIRKQLIILHKNLGFEVKEYGKRIKMADKKNIKKFAEILGFSKGIYLSYPKSKFHGIEKRKVLNMVIKSYN